jgi:uracil-DNA glycosylase family 4
MASGLDRLRETGNKEPLMGQGKKSARILVVQENLLESEYRRKQYMDGKAGRMFRAALSEMGIDLDDVYFTALVKHTTPEDRPPLPDEVKESMDLMLAEIDIIQPEIIIPTGNLSMKALMGVTAITKHRGKVIEKDGIKYLPMIHPNLVLKQPKYLDIFSEDMITLESVLNGTVVESRSSYEKVRRYCDTYEDAIDEINRLIALPPGTMVSIDLESTKANPYKEFVTMSKTAQESFPSSRRVKLSAIGFSDSLGYGCAIPLYHRQNEMSGNQIGMIIKSLRVLISRNDIEWTTQNGKFEIKWLRRQLEIDLENMVWDTMLMHYMAITEEKGTHGLDDFSWLYTDMGGYDADLNNVKPKGEDKGNYDLIDWDILKVYLADDCDVTLRLGHLWKPLITDNPEMKWLWENIMVPLSYTLADVEANGLKVDVEWLKVLEESYPKEIDRIETKLHEFPEVLGMEREWKAMWDERCAIGQIKKSDRTEEQEEKFKKWKKYDPNGKKDGERIDGTRMNFGSSAQLAELLFNRLGLKTVVLTEKGNLSTNDDSLKYMEKQHAVTRTLMQLRKVKHLHNNFVAGMREHLDSDGIIHPNYNIHGTVTGRLSSDEPNAQQFPRKVSDVFSFQYWNEIKTLFISRFGKDGVIVQFDYSQLELRILAVFTQDEALIELYRSGADLHKAVGADAFGVPIDEVTKDQRTASKKIQFGIVYQESAKGLSEDLRAEGIEMTVAECQAFINKYFKRFPRVENWIANIKRYAKRNKHVKTLTNRIRHLDTIDSIEKSVASEAERQAVNAPIQSTGSDCTVMSLIQINKWLKETGKRSVICITVHDSIVLDCPKDEVVEVSTKVKHIMENLAEYNEFYSFLGDVPIVSEMEMGYNYGEAFECSIEDIIEQGVDGFLQSQISKKKSKEEEEYKKAEDAGAVVGKHVTGYWEAS